MALVWMLASVAWSGPTHAAPTVIEGGDGAFRATIPDGYESAGADEHAGSERWFARRARGSEGNVVLVVRMLRGTIGRDPASRQGALEALRARSGTGAIVREENGRTMGLDVPVLLARGTDGSETVLATLPALPRAVQLVATGDAAGEAEMLRAVRAVMGSFRAKSNWLTDAEVQRRTSGRVLLVAAWSLLAAYAFAWLLRFRNDARKAAGARAGWLLACAALFGGAAGLLASVPEGATALGPIAPALVGVVVAINAVMLWTQRARA